MITVNVNRDTISRREEDSTVKEEGEEEAVAGGRS